MDLDFLWEMNSDKKEEWILNLNGDFRNTHKCKCQPSETASTPFIGTRLGSRVGCKGGGGGVGC